MNTSHTNHRNPIGFKVTDNKLMAFEGNKNELEVEPITPRDEAVFKMVIFIHQKMEERSKMFVHSKPFFEIEGDKIISLLNKIYIKYYEEI